METFEFKNIKITLNYEGSKKYLKVSYPLKYGMASIVETDRYLYFFNRNSEIRYIQFKGKNSPGDEWLKRTVTGNWVYYTPGIYTGIYSFLGEYYLPCFQDESNSIFAFRPFDNREVEEAINSLRELSGILLPLAGIAVEEQVRSFIESVLQNNLSLLQEKAKRINQIIKGNVSVLPPDARHVDYDVIPVIISDGCIYNCDFCMVKSGEEFKVRERTDIEEQLQKLKCFYDRDMINYNSIFLGMHDALNSGEEIIGYTLHKARDMFNFNSSYMSGCNLFLFGSVESILFSREELWNILNKSGFYTYINVGIESFDPRTLKRLNKPITTRDIDEAFEKIIFLNRKYENIEVTVNFLMGDDFPESHYESIVGLCRKNSGNNKSKTTIYLSPLPGSRSITALQNKFKEIKTAINMPVYLYLIQPL